MKAIRSFKKRGSPDCPIAIGRYEDGMYLPPKPHYHPEIEIAYVRQGHILCIVDDEQLHLSAGDILILSPEQTHLYQSPSVDANIHFLIFSLDALALPMPHIFQQEFVQPLKEGTLQIPQMLNPSHPVYNQITQLLNNQNQLFSYDPHYKLNRYCILVNICTALLPWCTKKDILFPTRINQNPTVRSAMVYIHNRYHQPLTLHKIAEHVHLNPSYLSALFKTHTGKTVTQYLTRTRIDAAVYLLQHSDLNISQISEKAGFRSESAFYHHFQELMGTSPRAFRQSSQKEA